MPALVHMALCADAVVDSATNNVSLHKLIEEVQIPAEVLERSLHENILAAGQMAIYALLSREWPTHEEPLPFDLQLRLRMPSGETVDLVTAAADSQPSPRVRVIFKMVGLPLRGEGLYTFELLLGGEEIIGSVPVRVQAVDLAALPIAPAPAAP